jgi:hypothetical protein
VFRVADFADFPSFLVLTLHKNFSLPKFLSALLAKSFATKMTAFDRLKSCLLFQALGASTWVGNKSAVSTVAPGSLIIVRHLLFNLLAEQENRVRNEIKADLFLSAAETK